MCVTSVIPPDSPDEIFLRRRKAAAVKAMVAIRVLSPFALSWAQGTQTPGIETVFSKKVEDVQTCSDM